MGKKYTTSFDTIIADLAAYEKENPREISQQDGPLVDQLKALKKSGKKYSDVISAGKDGNELQWVHFVQEGGGTLGIALVGYAFVLEYLGIRFLRLAGTSAGAINTIFLAAIGNKDDPKTPELYNMMTDPARFNMKSFVDASTSFVRWLLFSFGKGMGMFNNLLIGFITLLLLVLIPMPLISHIGIEGKVVYYIFLFVFLVLSVCIAILLFRFSKYNFGINPGEQFKLFLKKELSEFGINTKADLDKKAKGQGDFEVEKTDLNSPKRTFSTIARLRPVLKENGFNEKNNLSEPTLSLSFRPGVEYAHDENQSIDAEYKRIEYDYSFVSTDISNKSKVVFPEDADLYFNQVDTVNPSEFIRASMAIPVFFEPQFFPEKPEKGKQHAVISPACKKIWKEKKGIEERDLANTGVLIDGGSLSNFPINLFHNPRIKHARLPIMGVRIQDEKPEDYEPDKRMSFGSYAGSIINTLRSNEDSSFLGANPFYKRFCIEEIEAYNANVNWLNFDLTKHQKEKLFAEGVKAAIKYLRNFNWEEYKKERAAVYGKK
ncbi:MAG: patatin-like phospholipase family protein [Chitinophagaceae bacterium]|nr:patatin-like phospholipase family protein [Chitinophagaceae bacterium]